MFKTIGVLHQISKFRNTTTLTEWQESSLVTGRTGQEKQKASLKNVWPLEEIRKQKEEIEIKVVLTYEKQPWLARETLNSEKIQTNEAYGPHHQIMSIIWIMNQKSITIHKTSRWSSFKCLTVQYWCSNNLCLHKKSNHIQITGIPTILQIKYTCMLNHPYR